MSNNYRPQGSEKIQDPDQKLARIREISGITPKPNLNEQHRLNTKFSTVLHEAVAADGNTYGLVQDGAKVYLKRLVNDHYEYLTGDEKDYAYRDFATAFKHMNFVFKDISERYQHEAPINIFEGGLTEKKNLTERFILKTPQAQAPASQPVAPPAPPAGDMPPAGGEPPMGDQPPADPQASQELGREIGDVEGQAEDQDPAKAIQKLTGKLTEKMRTADEQIMTSEFMKGVINSVISAINVQKLEDPDLLSIIKKLKGEENPEAAGEAMPSGAYDEFKDDEGIDYNVNNPANTESGDQPLKEEAPVAGFIEGDTVTLNRPLATFRETFSQGLKGTVRTVSQDGNLWLDLEDGRDIGWVAPTAVTKQQVMAVSGGLPSGEAPIQEEITEPTWDDQTMPNILGQIVQNLGVEINTANEDELKQAVTLFVNTYGGDQNQTDFMKQLQDYLNSNGMNEGINSANLSYSSLSPMGQQVFDQLEVLDPTMGDLNQGEEEQNSTKFLVPPANSPALAAETKSYLKDKIMEALNTR